jgi:hypothetical protein
MLRLLPGTLIFLSTAMGLRSADVPPVPREKLIYGIEWKLLHAGTATVESQPGSVRLTLESAGVVSALIKIKELYNVNYDDPICATGSTLDSVEGKRHHDTKITFDRSQGRAFFVERDLVKNSTVRDTSVETPACVQDVLGALMRLRGMKLEPGQSAQLPVSDGRKSAAVKVEAQARENIKTAAGSFPAVRYEANLMNGVIYTRPGRVLAWLSEDPRHLLVRVELRLNFPAGTVTLDLQKAERP